LTKVRVTVCIPHVMRENLLRKCLQSLNENVSLPYRVIIINSGRRLSFQDEEILVVNDPERKGIGAKRQLFAELVKTEYMFFLDNDMIVYPGSLEAQIRALDENLQLAAVSGLCFQKGKFHSTIADFKFIGDKVVKQTYSFEEILASKRDLFEADFIPIGHTTFRMKAVKDIAFDPNYEIGYEHWDTFMQLYYTDWKCAVHKKSWFSHLQHESPREYLRIRNKASRIEKSRKYFIEKWGYHPSIAFETKRKKGAMLKVLSYMLWLSKRFLKSIHAM